MKNSAIALVWVLCGVLAYGITFGYFTREYPRSNPREHIAISVVMAVSGPFGLVNSIICSRLVEHGIRYR